MDGFELIPLRCVEGRSSNHGLTLDVSSLDAHVHHGGDPTRTPSASVQSSTEPPGFHAMNFEVVFLGTGAAFQCPRGAPLRSL